MDELHENTLPHKTALDKPDALRLDGISMMRKKPVYRKWASYLSNMPPRVLKALDKLQKSGSEKVWFVQARKGGSHDAWEYHPAAFHWRNEARALAVRVASPKDDDWRIVRWISPDRRSRQEALWKKRYDKYHPPPPPKPPTKEQIERQKTRTAKQELRQAQSDFRDAKKKLLAAQEKVSMIYRNQALGIIE